MKFRATVSDQNVTDPIEHLKKLANSKLEGDITPFADLLVLRAFEQRASDIHIEPREDDFLIRVRIDGLLEELLTVPRAVGISLVSRYKVMARLNIVERRRPQDGQFTTEIEDHVIDVRMSTVATLYGEKTELRLLDTHRELAGARELGMSAEQLNRFHSLLRSQHGLVVAAGPTGAGKTTTLHNALSRLNSPNKNVVTIEDPIEYVLPGVNHIPVHEDIDVTFAVQLRAILRQDPDTILVGETRDAETARISIQAALAGRLVLTSLHATDAVGAIYRLYQMDIEPHLISAALGGIISQRLVRRVCTNCKVEQDLTDSERALVELMKGPTSFRASRGSGCDKCRSTGYYGRTGVFQILQISHQMRELIAKHPEPQELQQLASSEGVRSFADEAFDLAVLGETTINEVALLAGIDV